MGKQDSFLIMGNDQTDLKKWQSTRTLSVRETRTLCKVRLELEANDFKPTVVNGIAYKANA